MFLSASEIVGEICKFSMHELGIGSAPDFKKLEPLSLQDMLDAVREVQRENDAAASVNGTRTFQVIPDDRLTAAVYTFLHYCTPTHHEVGDRDDAIVHLKIAGNIHGLVKYARSVQ